MGIEGKHVLVIVMGDIGRSPRMQYHALSLLEHGYRVSLVGYAGEDLITQLLDRKWDQALNVIRMNPLSFNCITMRPVRLILRMFALLAALINALFRKSSTVPVDIVLVQNPPSIPLLFVAWFYANSILFFSNPLQNKRPAFIIDWHNLGFSMFELPDAHLVTVIARAYEKCMAPLSDANFCVSSAMDKWLNFNFNISCQVLRDRPPDFFHSTSLQEQHECLFRLKQNFRACAKKFHINMEEINETLCTIISPSGDIKLRKKNDRPRIIVSSTSWTPDEDFSVMLDALIILEQKIDSFQSAIEKPKVLVIITGKGPQKAYYEKRITDLMPSMKHIFIMTMWLESADYPKLIGFSDIGLSLHTSTSGIDLPMKVLDFFGGELPVCARRFGCIDELVDHGSNGLIFDTSEELSDQIFQLLTDEHLFQSLKQNISGMRRWRENWNENAENIFESLATNQPTVPIVILTIRIITPALLVVSLYKLLM